MLLLQEGGGWTCKHGPQECEGDKQQLCVQKYTEPQQRYNWLYSFIMCNNQQGLEEVGTFKTALTCLKVSFCQHTVTKKSGKQS